MLLLITALRRRSRTFRRALKTHAHTRTHTHSHSHTFTLLSLFKPNERRRRRRRRREIKEAAAREEEGTHTTNSYKKKMTTDRKCVLSSSSPLFVSTIVVVINTFDSLLFDSFSDDEYRSRVSPSIVLEERKKDFCVGCRLLSFFERTASSVRARADSSLSFAVHF